MVLPSLPGTLSSLFSAATTSKGDPGKTPVFPPITIAVADVRADGAAVAKFREVCGFSPDAETLPLPYPHIMAFPLHLKVVRGGAKECTNA